MSPWVGSRDDRICERMFYFDISRSEKICDETKQQMENEGCVTSEVDGEKKMMRLEGVF